MSRSTYFAQECPTCGRNLHVRVEYLGKRVVCQHCHGRFLAWDPEGSPSPAPAASDSGLLLRRADELLEMVQTRRSGRAR